MSTVFYQQQKRLRLNAKVSFALVALSNLQSTPVPQRQNHHSAFCLPCQDIFFKKQ
nr:MAG TPA: hypothetical protein [Caudoviricetes sp.]